MKFYDVSLELSENTPFWPGDTRFLRREIKSTAITSKLIMSSHSGTHLDAPKHFLLNEESVDRIALRKFFGRAKVASIASSPQITLTDVKKINARAGDKILFKTRNAKLAARKKFTPDYVSLSLAAAKYLASKKIDLVGIDYFGIEAKSAPGHPVHKALLRAGIVIIEGLDLSKVAPGNYHLAALPLRIKDGDGSPARVVLWR